MFLYRFIQFVFSVLSFSLFSVENPLNPQAPITINNLDYQLSLPFSSPIVGMNGDGYMALYLTSHRTLGGTQMAYSFSSTGSSWSSGFVIDPSQTSSTVWCTGTLAGFLATFLYPPPGGGATSLQSSFSSDQGSSWSAFSVVDAGPLISIISLTPSIVVPGGILASWLESSLIYTSFSSDQGTNWSSSAQVGSPGSASTAPILCLNSDGLLASWRLSDTVLTSFSTDLGATWSSDVTVATGAGTGLGGEIYCSCNSQGFMVTWIDFTLQEVRSSFSTDNGTTWSSPTTVSNDINTSTTNLSFVTATGDSGFIVTWVNGAGNVSAAFSDDQGSTWSDPVSITDDGAVDVSSGRSLVYAVCEGNSCLLSWRQASTQNAMVSLSSLNIAPNPPQGGSGKQVKNDFGLQFELFNLLQWNASDSSDVAGYYVYKNGARIATLSQNTLFFKDHNQSKGVQQTYTVSAFNSNGLEGSSISITITP